jgi:ERCC4-type nuclease
MSLCIDDREPVGIRTLFDTTDSQIHTEVKRLKCGDFGFYINQKLIFVIERKTWADLAASIRDGRLHSQLTDLLSVWTQCQEVYVFLIIEGRWNRSIRIPKDRLERKITSIMFEYPFIQFIYTNDKEKTVSKILELCDMAPRYLGMQPPNLLNEKKQTVKQMAYKALASICGININTSKALLKIFHVFELFELKSADQLTEIKYPSGCRMGIRSVKIYNLFSKTKSLVKFLGGISGITADTASDIDRQMKTVPRSEWSTADLAKIIKTKTGKKIGNAVASKCFKIWIFRDI